MLLTSSEARIRWPHGNSRCIFINAYQCNACFLQTHVVNALNFIPCSGIKDNADLEGSQFSRKLFSVNVTLIFN